MITLYSYWRSTAAYRVRLALNLKGLKHDVATVSLVPGVSEHRQDAYRAKNPQMLVPFLEDGDVRIGQSMAMLEYLEERYPEVPLLPAEHPLRSQVRSFCNLIACDMHPLMNLRVLQYIKNQFNTDPAEHWYPHWINEGFNALEKLASDGPFVFGDQLTLADCLLIPQMYNANRFSVPVDNYPKLIAVVNHCNKLDAFRNALPENQPDAD